MNAKSVFFKLVLYLDFSFKQDDVCQCMNRSIIPVLHMPVIFFVDLTVNRNQI